MPLSYADFVQQKTRFVVSVAIEIGGEDVSDLLIDGTLETESLLDVPSFNIFATSTAEFELDNSDNAFNTKASRNFFTDLDRPANGWQTGVCISARFIDDDDAPEDAKFIFSGFIEEIVELSQHQRVLVKVLDRSALLQQARLDNFGQVVKTQLKGPEDAPDYSVVNPVFKLPIGTTPISYRSLEADIDNRDLSILFSLPDSGVYGNYLYAGVQYNTGDLYLGGEPPDKSEARINVTYKSAYRYRTPEALIDEVLKHLDVYSVYEQPEKDFARTLLQSPILENSRPQFSSHGRPAFSPRESVFKPVIRWIDSSLGTFYLGGDNDLFKYVRRDEATGVLDTYSHVSRCPRGDENIVQFVLDENNAYVVTVNDWTGRLATLWRAPLDGSAWTEFSGTDITAEQFYDYNTQSDPVADNRKSFTRVGNWIYYVFASNRVGVDRNGVRRVHRTNGTVQNIKQAGDPTDYGFDFIVDSNRVYVFECQRHLTSNTNLNLTCIQNRGRGTSSVIYRESWPESERSRPVSVSDIVRRGLNFYFVLTYSRREARVGYSELCKIAVSSTPPQGVWETYSASTWVDPISIGTISVDSEMSPNFGKYSYTTGFVGRRGEQNAFYRIGVRIFGPDQFVTPQVALQDNTAQFLGIFDDLTGAVNSITNYDAAVNYYALIGFTMYRLTSYTARVDQVGDRFVLKRYNNSLYSARGLVVHREDGVENIYFSEGNWVSILPDVSTYPTFEDAGHFFQIDQHDMLIDLGPAWRSERDIAGSGRGMHTAFCSNIHRNEQDDTLHLISGYGLPANPTADSIQTVGTTEASTLTNWVWLQYGTKLATKIPVFPTNGKSVWALLEELARVVDYELGWVPGDREIANFLQTYQHLDEDDYRAKGYLLFRPRREDMTAVTVDESYLLNVTSELDTTLIFNNVSMSFGDRFWISEDEDRVSENLARNYHIENDCLTGADDGWAETICEAVLERQKRPKLKSELPLKFSPHLELGDLVRVTSGYHDLDDTPYRIVSLMHDTDRWQTLVEVREDLEAVNILKLKAVSDRIFYVGDSIDITLPEATGGSGSYTYTVSDNPSWLSFTPSTRVLMSAPLLDTQLGINLLSYTVTDTSDPVQVVSHRFRIEVREPIEEEEEEDEEDVEVVEGVQHLWSAMGITSSGTVSQVLMIDNENNMGHAFRYPNEDLSVSVNLGSGDWVDAAGFGLNYVLLDKTDNGRLVRSHAASSDLSDIDSVSASDITLPPGDWVAVTMNGTYIYVLNKTDLTVYVYDAISGAPLWNLGDPQLSPNIPIDIDAEFSSMAVTSDGELHLLLGNGGMSVIYNISDGERSDTFTKMYFAGVSDWIGLNASSVTGRVGLYAARRFGSRVLAFHPGRESGSDFYDIL